jgi:phosphate starvation-inducible PhoH-like protein
MNGETSTTLTLEGRDEAVQLFGSRDQYLRMIRDALNVRIIARGDSIHIEGPADAVDQAERAFDQLRQILQKNGTLTAEGVRTILSVVTRDTVKEGAPPGPANLTAVAAGRSVRPRTDGQARYVHAMRDNDVTFAIGPAGTGKSYLAVALAVQALQAKQVNRIILTRPAVEAGERLGFLPGDMLAKVDPYLRPLYDALYDMLDPEAVGRLMERGVIEVAPLAFMRGRTLNDSFIILDEAQNTTAEQMKMFLTRLGFGSKIVVTGDVTQIDLPDGRGRSGLLAVRDILEGVDGLQFVELGSRDVVRHRIVQDIVDAYAAAE